MVKMLESWLDGLATTQLSFRNSGGPLLDQHGLIIGINEVGIGSLGGAIPSNLAKKISDELAKNGFVSRSWTGLECASQFSTQASVVFWLLALLKILPHKWSV